MDINDSFSNHLLLRNEGTLQLFVVRDNKLIYKEFYIPAPVNAMQKVNVIMSSKTMGYRKYETK